MKSILHWTSLAAVSLAVVLFPATAQAQTPVPQGTFVSDAPVPTVIAPAVQGSEYFVLNQDLSLFTHSSVDSSFNGTCAAPTGFSATSATPRTFLNDTQNAYFTAASGSGANAAVSGFSFINTGLCQPINGPAIAGGTPTQSFSSNDTFHARYYVLSAFNGNGPDTLTVEVNLNNALSGGNYVTQLKSVPLDMGAQYTSMVTDTSGGATGHSLTAVTELKTATSPGNLWVYNPVSGAAYKILGPGGVPLPAVGSFLIPAQTNGGGALLVLINQDNLTAENLTNPPLDATPFTIIDLGQLIQTFSIQTTGGTVTLPFVTQISATTPYFAMLGAAYNPVTRLVYAMVGGGSLSGVTGNIISYDPLHPGSPNETVVGDVSNIPTNFGAYPQLALSAASGTLQILTSNPAALWSVGITGTGNLAVPVPGAAFPDANFKPTYIAANPLLGETYIASASGQVDILKNAGTKPLATFTINGADIATTTQGYALQATAHYPTVDDALRGAPVTITATPPSPGKAFTAAAGTFGNFGLNPSSIPIAFPAVGVYTLVASIPATANYPAITSNAVNVTVADNFIAGVYPTTLSITAPTNPPTTAVNVLVNLAGSTYAPTGHIDVTDGTGKVVGTTYFNGGALVQPTTVAVTLLQGPNTLSATYSGDAQNAPTTSPTVQVSVGTVVTPTLTLTAASPAYVGNTVTGSVTFRSTTTQVPTDYVTIYGLLNGTGTPIALTKVTAAQAFTGSGASFSFAAPAAGTYEIYASFPGDTNYASALSAQQSLITNPVPVKTTTVVTGPSTPAPGVPFNINVKLTSGTTTSTPTGNVVVTAVLNSTGASTTLSTISAAQAFVTAGYAAQVSIATAGSYTVTANYAGDANFDGSSSSLAVTVGSTLSTATINVSGPTNVTQNVPSNITITLRPQTGATAVPTGNIVISTVNPSGVTAVLGTITAADALASGGDVATINYSIAGNFTVTATYAGDANFSGSKASLVVVVTAPTTTVGLSGATNQAPGVAFPLTVRLAAQSGVSATPTGNVVLTTLVGSTKTTLATVTAAQALASGGYAAQVTLAAAGNYIVTATYAGDANFGSSSASLAVNVTSTLSTANINLSGPTNVMQNVPSNLTITLTPQTGATAVPTGNIVLSSVNPSGVPAVLGTITAAQALASGGDIATINYSLVGNFTVTATYAGDANFSGSKASLLITVSPVVYIATSLTVKAPPTASVGTPYQAAVILTPASVSSPSPTGTVTLSSTINGTTTPLATFTAAQALSGALYTVPATTAGSVVLTAAYAGDARYSAAPSVSTTVVVGTATGLTPHISVTSNSATGPGIPTDATVVLLGAGSQQPNPTGSITITITPQSGGGPTVVGTIDAAKAGLSSGSGVISIRYPEVGQYTIAAVYGGDNVYSAVSATVGISVEIYTDTLAIDGPATGPASSSPITFNLTQSDTASAITGDVTIASTCNGSPGPSTTLPAVIGSNNPRNFSLVFPKAGTCILVATYAGDADNLPAMSPPFTITLSTSGTPGFTSFITGTSQLSLVSPKVTSTTLTLTAQNGFNTAVAFTYVDAATNAAPVVDLFIEDAVSGNVLKTVVPTTNGVKLTLGVRYLSGARLDRPLTLRNSGILACVLLCAGCFKVRRRYSLRWMRLLTLALFLCGSLTLVGCDGPLGCSTAPHTSVIHVIATPVNGSQNAAPQTVDVTVNS